MVCKGFADTLTFDQANRCDNTNHTILMLSSSYCFAPKGCNVFDPSIWVPQPTLPVSDYSLYINVGSAVPNPLLFVASTSMSTTVGRVLACRGRSRLLWYISMSTGSIIVILLITNYCRCISTECSFAWRCDFPGIGNPVFMCANLFVVCGEFSTIRQYSC